MKGRLPPGLTQPMYPTHLPSGKIDNSTRRAVSSLTMLAVRLRLDNSWLGIKASCVRLFGEFCAFVSDMGALIFVAMIDVCVFE